MAGVAEDVFDRLIRRLLPQRCQAFFGKHREKLLYLFFGGSSFFLNVGSYGVFSKFCLMGAPAANLASWILTVAFVYVTNRIWVFRGEYRTGAALRRQIMAFYGGRLATLFVEEAIIAVFVVYLAFPGMPVKVAAQVIVTVLNYIISKRLVFKALA